MFTMRNLGGIALLLAGSTWIWTTPAFAGPGVSTSGVMWGLSQALSLLTVAGFCIATWGLIARHGWWESVAVGSAVLGLAAVVVFWIAAYAGRENVGAATWNAFVHLLIAGGILTLLLAPRLEHWVNQHVMAR